jgi:hypothetical protein
VNRALLPLLLALPLGCRGTFDLGKYVADAESGTATTDANTTDGTATTDASATTLDSSTTDDATDTTSAETETADTETETTDTDAECLPPLTDVGGACIGLKQTLLTLHAPTDIEVADFSNDNVLDLLVSGFPVSYYGGSDGGAFTDQLPIIGSAGSALAAVDWNDDNHLDVLVIDEATIRIWFSTLAGGGAFDGGTQHMYGGHDAVFANLDADEFEDIILTGPILFGLQRMNDDLLTNLMTVLQAQGLVVADLDLNPGPDIALALNGMGKILVIPTDGAWNFGAQMEIAFPLAADVAVADLDALEGFELIAVGGDVPGQLMVLKVNGAVLEQVTSFVVGDLPRAVAVGDINSDSLTDVAVGNASSHNVSILLGEDGGLTNAYSLPVDDSNDVPESIEVADLDNDSYAEIIVGMIGSNRVLVYGHME